MRNLSGRARETLHAAYTNKSFLWDTFSRLTVHNGGKQFPKRRDRHIKGFFSLAIHMKKIENYCVFNRENFQFGFLFSQFTRVSRPVEKNDLREVRRPSIRFSLLRVYLSTEFFPKKIIHSFLIPFKFSRWAEKILYKKRYTNK